MTSANPNIDQRQRFSFDNTDIRGEIALLENSYQAVLERHDYPALIANAIGELMAATALLSSNLKFAGRITLQVRLPGNVSLLQAESNEQGELRAIARYDNQANSRDLALDDGQLAITIEPENGQRYQGITAIQGGDIAQALTDYFEQSEQLGSRFWLFCNGQRAAGFMLQKLPSSDNNDPDAWDRLTHLASTIKADELLSLSHRDMLHRLYHEELVRTYPHSALSFHCTCSKDRTGNALHQLGYDELNDMLNETGSISITCEFCQQEYRFLRDDVEALFPERHPH